MVFIDMSTDGNAPIKKTNKLAAPKTLRKSCTGIRGLDEITGGGLPAGRPTLVCGAAGCGKTLLAMEFLVRGAIEHNEPGVFMTFEETDQELADNVASLGFDLKKLVARKKLLLDYAMLTDKISGDAIERTDAAISSLVDTWLVLRDLESNGERNRGLHILKSRGMGHSNQVREFVLSDTGIQLTDVYIGPSGMLTGSARVSQEARERAERVSLDEEAERQQLALECKRAALEGQIAALRAEFSAEETIIARSVGQDKQRGAVLASDEVEMGRSRQSDVKSNGNRIRRNVTGREQS